MWVYEDQMNISPDVIFTIDDFFLMGSKQRNSDWRSIWTAKVV